MVGSFHKPCQSKTGLFQTAVTIFTIYYIILYYNVLYFLFRIITNYFSF